MEANHHAITAPGAANSDPFRERQQPPFAAPGHSLPLCVPLHSKTNNLHPRLRGKKGPSLSLSLSPPSTLFSASFLQITGGPTDRSPLLASGESTPREWRRFHFENRSTDAPSQPTYYKRSRIVRARHWPECGSSTSGLPSSLQLVHRVSHLRGEDII